MLNELDIQGGQSYPLCCLSFLNWHKTLRDLKTRQQSYLPYSKGEGGFLNMNCIREEERPSAAWRAIHFIPIKHRIIEQQLGREFKDHLVQPL